MRDNGSMSVQRLTVVVIWVAALFGVVSVGLIAVPERQVTWVSILMLVLICATCILQLSLQEAEGFVRRMSESLVGALIILALGSLVLAILGGGAMVGVSGPDQ